MRFSMVWISAQEQIELEKVITKMLERFLYIFGIMKYALDRNKQSLSPEEYNDMEKQYALLFKVGTFDGTKGTIDEVFEQNVIEAFITFKAPEGVKVIDLTRYLGERLKQLIFLFSIPYRVEYEFKIIDIDPGDMCNIRIEWKKRQ